MRRHVWCVPYDSFIDITKTLISQDDVPLQLDKLLDKDNQADNAIQGVVDTSMDGRIVNGLPRRARAVSGPSPFPVISGPSTLRQAPGDVDMEIVLGPGTLHTGLLLLVVLTYRRCY